MNKLAIAAIFIATGISVIQAGSLAATTAKQFEMLSAYSIYGLIERAKIAAFSTDSFKRSGADLNSIATWNTLTDGLNLFAIHTAAPGERAIIERYIRDLTHTRAYIEQTIQNLKAGSATSLGEAQKHALNISIIEREATEKLRSTSQPDSRWISQIPRSNILNKTNLKVLNDYKKLAKLAEKDQTPIYDFEIMGLLKLNKITTNIQIGSLVNNLEQYNYKKPDPQAKQFLKDLSRVYPNTLSTYFMSIIANTKNKPYMIIFAQAGAYANILQQIMRELRS